MHWFSLLLRKLQEVEVDLMTTCMSSDSVMLVFFLHSHHPQMTCLLCVSPVEPQVVNVSDVIEISYVSHLQFVI